MPLTISIPGRELYDEERSQFIEVKPKVIVLEHSLLSISKWESKWHKPWYSNDKKTKEEWVDYIRCMTISGGCDPNIYYALSRKNYKDIEDYIQDSMTATTFKKQNKKPSREMVTSELVYYWMTTFNIPFSCEKWHINRLFTLIEIASIKNQPPKKVSKADAARQRSALNAARRAKHGTRG